MIKEGNNSRASVLKPGFEGLRQLAALAVKCPATRKGLTIVADALRDALGAEHVWFVYAEDQDWDTCGDSCGGDGVGTGKIGLWLVQHQAQTRKVPVAFNIRSKRVEDFARAAGARGREYLAMRIPTTESPADMVILRGPWKEKIDHALARFLEAARPSLVMFLERMLNAARAEREREQQSALANAAEVLTRAEDAQAVLGSIATAMSNSSGFELVTIVLWDEASQTLGPRVMGTARWEDNSLTQVWTNPPDSRFDGPFIEAIRQRQPLPSPDLQNDLRNSEEFLEFCKWIMAVSGCSVPVLFQDEPLAAISFASWRSHTFPPEEIETLKGLAAQLAVGLKAMQMYRALAESKEQLEKYSKQLQANTEIEHRLARTDALTGIPNRRYVEEVLEVERARARRQGRPFSVGLLDVDKLKAVNDKFGHDAGDEVLIQLARLARRACRKGDVVGRYGGDEFLFVLPEADLPAAIRFAERLRSRIEGQPFRLPRGDTLTLRVSLGIAEGDSVSLQGVPGVIATADAALYVAKSSGGNSVCTQPAARVA